MISSLLPEHTDSDTKTMSDNKVPDVSKKILRELLDARKEAQKNGVSAEAIRKALSESIVNHKKSYLWILKKKYFWVAVVSILLGLLALTYEDLYARFQSNPCIIDNNPFVMEAARPLQRCDICKDMNEVPVEVDISTEEFISKYAYTSKPVLVKGATKNWTAMDTFSYDFFKKLYNDTPDALSSVEEECQFFPYKTEFETLAEVFNMSDDRAHFKPGEKNWYIGWSNCNPSIQDTLRQHYQRPYFLPKDSESSAIDWIFMGGSGPGAHMHLDYVQRPSWQAQISGTKIWTLLPSYECESVCKPLNVTVQQGDIIVVDTNQWYHATRVVPGAVSICIGSEYD